MGGHTCTCCHSPQGSQLRSGCDLEAAWVCASVKKVIVSIVANHNNGCEGRGYSLVTANVNGKGGKVRNHQTEKSFIGLRSMRSRHIARLRCRVKLWKLKLSTITPSLSHQTIIYCGFRKTEGKINPLSTKLYLSDLKTHFLPRSKHSLLRF